MRGHLRKEAKLVPAEVLSGQQSVSVKALRPESRRAESRAREQTGG